MKPNSTWYANLQRIRILMMSVISGHECKKRISEIWADGFYSAPCTIPLNSIWEIYHKMCLKIVIHIRSSTGNNENPLNKNVFHTLDLPNSMVRILPEAMDLPYISVLRKYTLQKIMCKFYTNTWVNLHPQQHIYMCKFTQGKLTHLLCRRINKKYQQILHKENAYTATQNVV